MGNFLSTHHLQLSDIRHIALTGVGSSYVEGDIYGVKTIKVEEFPSVGVGGLALSGKEHAVVVSMGTGTSFLWANKGGEIRHLIGSGVGGGTLAGMGLLDMETVFHREKTRRQVSGRLGASEGIFAGLCGREYSGYEIHMGKSTEAETLVSCGNIYGSYVHGLFDADGIADGIVEALCGKKGIQFDTDAVFDGKASVSYTHLTLPTNSLV